MRASGAGARGPSAAPPYSSRSRATSRPRARAPRAYVEQNWAEEPGSRGCYVGFAAPGVLLDYGDALRAPVGRIHWAGTETATEWNGYMDGAVQSGQRVAAEVHAML